MKMPKTGILEFWFENILLPDSNINEPASHGYIVFEARTLPHLPLGTRIENRAGIYFDFNAPIITNTVVNTLADLSAIQIPETVRIEASVSPNPGKNGMLVFTLESTENVYINIFDNQGRLVKNVVQNLLLSPGQHQYNISSPLLSDGLYYIYMETKSGKRALVQWVKGS